MSTHEELKQVLEAKESARWRIGKEFIPIVLIVLLSIFIRLSAQPQVTIFYDEAVNATLGEEILSGNFIQSSNTWTFGSYLFPIVTSVFAQAGGQQGIYLLTLSLNLVSILFVFLLTKELFGTRSGVIALLIFALLPASLNLSYLAVYDALGIPLLAASLYLVIASSQHRNPRRFWYLVFSGTLAALSLLSKYIAIAYLPSVGLAALGVYIYRKQKIFDLFAYALLPFLIIIGAYVLAFSEQLIQVFTNQDTLFFIEATQSDILTVMMRDGAVTIIFGILGALLLMGYLLQRISGFKSVILNALVILYVLITLIVPFYHYTAGTMQSLWKHLFYSAIFLTPLASLFFDKIIGLLDSKERSTWLRLSYALVFSLIVAYLIQYSINLHSGFKRSYPDLTEIVSYLQGYNVTLQSRVLAEESAIYEFYLDLGANDRDVWSNTFYFRYAGLEDTQALIQAIKDQYFDLVILDDYYTAESNDLLRLAMQESGYNVVLTTEPQLLSTGQMITINVYQLLEPSYKCLTLSCQKLSLSSSF